MIHLVTDSRCTGYHFRGHPERPGRVGRTVERLRQPDAPVIEWTPLAGPAPHPAVLRAHSQAHLDRVLHPDGAFDDDTPAAPDIGEHALRSAGAALQVMELGRAGKQGFSLMRPPGHHATREESMGFCYLNNVAIATLEALATGIERVAVFDFDVHHGNGTEAILRDHPGAWFYSIHQHPAYPGTGTGSVGSNCFNYPVPPKLERAQYRGVLERALQDMAGVKPKLIAVSAGFDAYAKDPLAQGTLEEEDFEWLGRQLRGLGIPMFSLLEGGYSIDLPDLVVAYLRGLSAT